jgi:hypothetical protein
LSSSLKPTQCPSGDRYPGPPLQPQPRHAGRSGQRARLAAGDMTNTPSTVSSMTSRKRIGPSRRPS